MYGGCDIPGILAMVDASECVPTFGSGTLLTCACAAYCSRLCGVVFFVIGQI